MDTRIDKRRALFQASKSGDDNTLAVLLATSQLDVNLKDIDDRTLLSWAAGNGHDNVVEILLHYSAHLNLKGNSGRTALSWAAENGHNEVIELLLHRHGIDPNSKDNGGRTPLSWAAGNGRNEAIELLLHRHGVDPDSKDNGGRTPLSWAAGNGRNEAINTLLDRHGVDLNSKDNSGRTALSWAAGNGRDESIKILLYQHNVDPNLKDNSGQTPLLLATLSGHPATVKLLLTNGAVPSLRTESGLTAQDLIIEILNTQIDQSRKSEYEKIQSLFENLPAVKKTAETVQRGEEPWPLELDHERQEICKYFKAHVQFHRKDTFQPVIVSVWNLIYDPHISEVLLKQKQYDWNWFNLPANNILWNMILALHRAKHMSIDIERVQKFIEESFHEVRGPTPHACYRRPKFVDGSNDQVLFSAVIPYFDVESGAYLDWKESCKSSSTNFHFQKMQKLEDKYRFQNNQGRNGLHVSRTLDQSYYTALKDTTQRDRDQVFYRHTEKRFTEAIDEGNAAPKSSKMQNGKIKILMVNQLWLWRIGDTIITAFPERWHREQDQLLDQIRLQMSDSCPKTPSDMILQIVRECVGFHDKSYNAGLDDNWFTVFEQSIANQSQEETTYYDKLYQTVKRRDERSRDDFLDISEEMECLRQVKDIRDELHMIDRVVADQKAVVENLLERMKGQSKSEDQGLQPVQVELSGTMEKLVEDLKLGPERVNILVKEVDSVENWLHHLLDLKQKQGNLNEARDTRKLANEADKRARESETQSKLLYVFTIVTVVFTPLSFVLAFFAVPSQDFPYNGSVNWGLKQIAAGMGTLMAIVWLPIICYWVIIHRSKLEQQNLLTSSSITTPLSSRNDGRHQPVNSLSATSTDSFARQGQPKYFRSWRKRKVKANSILAI